MADKAWVFGIVLALIVGAVIIGGIKSIARVTEKLVPFMGAIYIIAALTIIIMHIDQLPTAIGAIFSGAFSAEGVTGGIIGVLIQGFKRAAFSNEAGIGSAPIAHAAAKTKEPVSEGIVSLLEPFIDTVVICTMTALVIVITGQYQNVDGISGVQLTSNAFASGISWFPYVLALAVILFAFSTLIAWSYYGNKAWNYIFGDSKTSDFLYKIIYCGFVVIGATMSLGSVIDFADSMIFAMALFNIAGLYLLAPVVKRELNSYWSRLQSGEIKKTN
jgi:AGCS family alanine or glycine:cation symporter